MPPFYGWGSTASRLEPLPRSSLLFTTKFPEIPGTHFIKVARTLLITDHFKKHRPETKIVSLNIIRNSTKHTYQSHDLHNLAA